jgi:tRNA (cytidine/uridine-2'-O-)-methyltransferase
VFNIVLLEPEIPQNTGNIARLCAATRCTLHLIEPLGFELSDKYLKRAGLDYWQFVDLNIHKSWSEFREHLSRSDARLWMLSKKVSFPYYECRFSKGDYLMFGKETKGIPEELLSENTDSCLTIPMDEPGVRSLNLANSVAIVLYEARRQVGCVNS